MAKQTYTTGQVLTAAQMTALQANDYNWTVSAKTASYVLVAADAGTRITMSNAGATTITVNTALFTAGDTLTITNIGAGACTITAGTATVSTAGSLVLNQYDSGTLYFSSTSAAIWNGANPGDITGVTAGTGISGGGTSGTVTITNSMATEITAAGDIIVGTGSGTFDNLPIGTTGQLLTADTTVSPYKVKWATPTASSSGLTLIKRASTSGAVSTGTTFDNVFTSTYGAYQVVIEQWYSATRDDDAIFRLRASAATIASGYYSAANEWTEGNSTNNLSVSNSATLLVASDVGGNGYNRTSLTMTIIRNTTTPPLGFWLGSAGGSTGMLAPRGAFFNNTQNTFDGFILSTAANMTCTVAVYGLATA